ncbi:hypothetical protein CKO25_15145 [Thiocapsa imhoffii]|uniref:Uncharacterized protein n=2 Tax=Thiocapsa imhoffii TaxID=382777 RepID=A0A9X0WJN7_9GAMM|nr:hypothetical protein [Thiocapsa imhoffii]
MLMNNPLERTLELIENAPESAAALTLYALVSTLEFQRAGCLFKLTKLQDLDDDERATAYGLMELFARGGVGSPAWEAAKTRMDTLIRAGLSAP